MICNRRWYSGWYWSHLNKLDCEQGQLSPISQYGKLCKTQGNTETAHFLVTPNVKLLESILEGGLGRVEYELHDEQRWFRKGRRWQMVCLSETAGKDEVRDAREWMGLLTWKGPNDTIQKKWWWEEWEGWEDQMQRPGWGGNIWENNRKSCSWSKDVGIIPC